MEQNMTSQSSASMEMSIEEMEMRQKYLRQPNETKEQREQRNANVRQLLSEAREATVGVKHPSVISAFEKGRSMK